MSRRTGRERMPAVGARRIAVGAGGWSARTPAWNVVSFTLRAADVGPAGGSVDDTAPSRAAGPRPAVQLGTGTGRPPAACDR